MPVPTVTLDEINKEIKTEYFFTGAEGVYGGGYLPMEPSLNLLTICILVTKNGFTIIGKSACARPDKYNKEIGERLAKEDAIRQLWPLMGWRLRDKLSSE